MGAAPLVLPAGAAGSIDSAIEVLRAGAIVALPTETVYGLAVLPRAGPLATMLAAKRRPREKGIALAVDSIAQVEGLAVFPAAARRRAERFWPGPLTLVLAPRRDLAHELPQPLLGPSGTLGFRLADHPVPRQLAACLGPIALTSANVSGGQEARTVDDLIAALGDALSLVLDGGPVLGGVASTVVAVDAAGGVTVLRAGALDAAEVLAART
ncbi:MAG: L-threonylcarbamoyladenylate synthase [Candidatus Limnocylindrales bacterium]